MDVKRMQKMYPGTFANHCGLLFVSWYSGLIIPVLVRCICRLWRFSYLRLRPPVLQLFAVPSLICLSYTMVLLFFLSNYRLSFYLLLAILRLSKGSSSTGKTLWGANRQDGVYTRFALKAQKGFNETFTEHSVKVFLASPL